MLFVVTAKTRGVPPQTSFVFCESAKWAREVVTCELQDERRDIEYVTARLPTSDECDKANRATRHLMGGV